MIRGGTWERWCGRTPVLTGNVISGYTSDTRTEGGRVGHLIGELLLLVTAMFTFLAPMNAAFGLGSLLDELVAKQVIPADRARRLRLRARVWAFAAMLFVIVAVGIGRFLRG